MKSKHLKDIFCKTLPALLQNADKKINGETREEEYISFIKDLDTINKKAGNKNYRHMHY